MRHKVPVISEVNIELKDFSFYFKDDLMPEKLSYTFSADACFEGESAILFFVHIRINYLKSPKKSYSLFHTDYISRIEAQNEDWSEKEAVEVDKVFLSHILGMSILMMRGYISQRLKGNPLGIVSLPIINPLDLLSNNLEQNEDNETFVLIKQFKTLHTPHQIANEEE